MGVFGLLVAFYMSDSGWLRIGVYGSIMLGMVAMGYVRWRSTYRQRAAKVVCLRCGYSRRGLTEGQVCPECGERPGEGR